MRKKNLFEENGGRLDDDGTFKIDDHKTVWGRLKRIFFHFETNLVIYLGLFFLFLVVFSLAAVFGLSGEFGRSYFRITSTYFGVFTYLAPLIYLGVACIFLTRSVYIFFTTKFWAIASLLFSIFIGIGFFQNPDGFPFTGTIGGDLATVLKHSIGLIPSVFLLVLVSLAALARIFESSLEEIFKYRFSGKYLGETKRTYDDTDAEKDEESVSEALHLKKGLWQKSWFSILNPLNWFLSNRSQNLTPKEEIEVGSRDEDDLESKQDQGNEDDVREAMLRAVSVEIPNTKSKKHSAKRPSPSEQNDSEEVVKENERKIELANKDYKRPPLSMYSPDSGKASAGDNKENARIIKRTLADFGISVEMDEVTVGPTVTRYALKPAQGVKIEKIVNLANNIALELGVPSVAISRVMERSLIGIEVPNKHKTRLGLGSLLERKEFLERPDRLTVVLGKDIYGDPIFYDLTKMPHLLIAGTTGSGKSSLIHVLIHSLIHKTSPYDIKFILIDPKKVEFGLYNHLPHLLTPVIKEPKKAIQTLNWLVQEMDRRYQVLEEVGKQNINAYHHYVHDKYEKASQRQDEYREKLPERMPFIVLVIDELADFMMKYPKEMESGIVKLAQMSRAVGIHLIVATQRPSTNVITGVIKANIPSRVALRVASQVDSRVIIDQGGAEKLLGHGDMLFVSADGSNVKRIQSPYMQENEIKEIVAYLRRTYDDVVVEELNVKETGVLGAKNLNGDWGGNNDGTNEGFGNETNFAEEDDKYEEAKQIVLQTKKTSISNLQVRLGTGYARSAKLINMLEQAGVITTITDNSGKQIKVVAGTESNKLEKEADKLLKESEVANNDDASEEKAPDKTDEADTKVEKNQKTSSSFFRF